MLKLFFTTVSRSLISLAGAVLTTISAILFFSLFAIEEFGSHNAHGGAYTGIIAFIIVPSMFVFGLVLMPLGVWRLRKADAKRAASGEEAAKAPIIDFNVPRTRFMVALVAVLSVVNIIIVATGTYKGIETMESTEFCGGACHKVMSPEFTTYNRSHHSRVRCTQCHIGPGANWFVKSKISGSWQLVSVAFNLYPRPIPTPVENLRPARDTCEQCHQPTRFVGERLKIITRFTEDEKNTAKKSVLMMKIGGAQPGGIPGISSVSKGVHWHIDPSNQVRYRSDKRRLFVSEIKLNLADGGVREFKNNGDVPADAGVISEEWRTMDCLDCHNRPSHVYQRPKDEVDAALTAGSIDATLPWIRREALRAVQVKYPSWDAAKEGLKKDLMAFYEKDYAELAKTDAAKINAAADALFNIYKANVFPEMNIQWGTYPSFRDHVDDSGCFRCHVGDMKSAEGVKVSQKCDLCHTTLAEEEENPEILELLSGE